MVTVKYWNLKSNNANCIRYTYRSNKHISYFRSSTYK